MGEILFTSQYSTALHRCRHSLKNTRYNNRVYLSSRCSISSNIQRHPIRAETFWISLDSIIVEISKRKTLHLPTCNIIASMQRHFDDHSIQQPYWSHVEMLLTVPRPTSSHRYRNVLSTTRFNNMGDLWSRFCIRSNIQHEWVDVGTFWALLDSRREEISCGNAPHLPTSDTIASMARQVEELSI